MSNPISRAELQSAIEELEIYAQEIEFQARMAAEVVQRIDSRLNAQAQSYWLPSIISNVTHEHEWFGGGSMISLADQIDDLKERLAEFDNECENYLNVGGVEISS